MAARPANVTLTIIQGQTFDDEFQFETSEGDPEDFTGHTARMQIRPFIESDEVLLELSTTNGLINALDDTGVIKFNVSATDTSDLSDDHIYQQWWYDLEKTDTDGKVQRLLQGAVIFWPETTR